MQVRFLKNFIGTTNSQRPLFTVRPEKVTFIESGNLSNNILYVYMQIEPSKENLLTSKMEVDIMPWYFVLPVSQLNCERKVQVH